MLVTVTGRVTNAREIKVTEQTTSVIAEKNETHGRLAHDGLALIVYQVFYSFESHRIIFSRFDQNFYFKIKRDHQKKFL